MRSLRISRSRYPSSIACRRATSASAPSPALALQAARGCAQIACLYEAAPLAQEARAAGIPVTALGARGIADPRTPFRLSQLLVRIRPDVVHACLFGFDALAALPAKLLRVPLILHAPRRLPAGKEIVSLASLADVAPTLLELAGLDAGDGLDGVSLLSRIEPGESESAEVRTLPLESEHGFNSYGWAPLRGATDGRHKWIDAPQPELYDLRSDPGELKNLVEIDVERATVMAEELDALVEGFATADISEREEALPPQHLEMLASLGYIGGSDEGREIANDTAPDLVDAKDRTEFINLMRVQRAKAIVTIFTGAAPVGRWLARFGFRRRPSSWKIMIHSDSVRLGIPRYKLLDVGNWFFTRADIDTEL